MKEKTKERTERQEQSESRREEEKKRADLLVLPRPAESFQNDAGFSGKI